jgi:hypothetical protein
MLTRTSWGVALVAAVGLAGRAAGQSAPTPDLRVLSLRSLQAGRTVRVRGQDIGTLTGSVAGVRDGALWLGGPSAERRVPLAGIDSVWVSRGHAGTGALVGGLVGAVVGAAAMSGKSCQLGDSNCMVGASLAATGIMLGGILVGALIGGESKSWELRYP